MKLEGIKNLGNLGIIFDKKFSKQKNWANMKTYQPN